MPIRSERVPGFRLDLTFRFDLYRSGVPRRRRGRGEKKLDKIKVLILYYVHNFQCSMYLVKGFTGTDHGSGSLRVPPTTSVF